MNKANTIINLVVTYGSAIILTWIGYLLHWINLVAAVGISLVLLGILAITIWSLS